VKGKKPTTWWCGRCNRPLRGQACPDCRISRRDSDELVAERVAAIRREVDAEKLAKKGAA
jgi:hypothetical protein